MISMEEGQRPISGDRRVSVEIVGEKVLPLNPKGLRMSPEGYLCLEDRPAAPSALPEQSRTQGDLKIVVVVGLLHANGVLQRLSEAATDVTR